MNFFIIRRCSLDCDDAKIMRHGKVQMLDNSLLLHSLSSLFITSNLVTVAMWYNCRCQNSPHFINCSNQIWSVRKLNLLFYMLPPYQPNMQHQELNFVVYLWQVVPTIPTGIKGKSLWTWSVSTVPTKHGASQNSICYLTWHYQMYVQYQINIERQGTENSRLLFSMTLPNVPTKYGASQNSICYPLWHYQMYQPNMECHGTQFVILRDITKHTNQILSIRKLNPCDFKHGTNQIWA